MQLEFKSKLQSILTSLSYYQSFLHVINTTAIYKLGLNRSFEKKKWMKFEKIKTLKILEITYFYFLMLIVRLKNILHIDTPEPTSIPAAPQNPHKSIPTDHHAL